MFEREVQFAKNNRPIPVYAQERLTKGACPYLKLGGTTGYVHAVPARVKEYGKNRVHMYLHVFDDATSWSQYRLGVHQRSVLFELIDEFGRSRDMQAALAKCDIYEY